MLKGEVKERGIGGWKEDKRAKEPPLWPSRSGRGCKGLLDALRDDEAR
jgi:hypothetical protein